MGIFSPTVYNPQYSPSYFPPRLLIFALYTFFLPQELKTTGALSKTCVGGGDSTLSESLVVSSLRLAPPSLMTFNVVARRSISPCSPPLSAPNSPSVENLVTLSVRFSLRNRKENFVFFLHILREYFRAKQISSNSTKANQAQGLDIYIMIHYYLTRFIHY